MSKTDHIAAIAATDGGAQPNPGFVGSGLKMYLYNKTNIEKQFKGIDVDNILSDFKNIATRFLDCVVDENFHNFDKVKPSEIINSWQGALEPSTNNCAEIDAATMAIELAIEAGVKYLMIGADSKYTLNGAVNIEGYAKSGWKKSDGNLLKNIPKWERFYTKYQELLATGCQIYFMYLPGHSDNPHNDAADLNATRGIMLSQQGISERVVQRDTSETVKPAKYNRLLKQSCWYLYSGQKEQPKSKDGRWVYSCGKHGPRDDWFGKRMSDTIHSVVFLKEQDPVLETLRKKHTQLANGIKGHVIHAKLDRILSGKMYQEITTYGCQYVRALTNAHDLNIVHANKTVLMKDSNPIGLAYEGMDVIALLENRLEQYLQGDYLPNQITDITKAIYSIETKKKKEVYKIRDDIPPTEIAVKVPINYICDGKPGTADVTLAIGYELPVRGTLTSITSGKPKIVVFSWPEPSAGFRYAVIVEVGNDIGIWELPYANLRLVKDG